MKNRRPSGAEVPTLRSSDSSGTEVSSLGAQYAPWSPEELARVQEEAAKSGWHFVGRSDDGMLMFSRELPDAE